MIERPTRLQDWSVDLVREIAASAMSENDWFDLKGNLQGQPEHQRKIVAAFANTQGGFLVFGVNNDRTIRGIANGELPRDFGSKLTHGLSPSVAFRFAEPLMVLGPAPVWICEVPRSQRGPHAVLMNDHWVFPRRTESGSNVSMNVEEIRLAFQDGENRRTKLALLVSELALLSDLAYQIVADAPAKPDDIRVLRDSVWLTRYPTTVLDSLLGDALSLLGNRADIWSSISRVRTLAHRSNALASAVATGITNTSRDNPDNDRIKHEGMVRDTAARMLKECGVALVLVKDYLEGRA